MQPDNFEIAENQQQLQYFSYIREMMETKEINYWIGNPSVEIINGTIFLKPGNPVKTCQEIDTYDEYIREYRRLLEEQCQQQDKMVRTLVLIGIPNSKNPIEVCEKLGGYLDWIQQIRVIKTNHFKFYGMLLLLKDQQKSKKFCYDIFGDEYNSLEIQRILVREMQQFSCVHTETSKADNEQLFQHRKKSNMGSESVLQKMPAEEIFMKSNSQNFNPNFASSPRKKQNYKNIDSPKIKAQKQKQNYKATCTICFEQAEGTLISILCSHYFHVKCLSQWKENICPLCRYHQQPPLIKFCEKCNQCEGLWVCLVCGVRLCCGFDHDILGDDSHIYQHYLETMHRLSMDVETKFIFDASQPAFLHQMLYKEVLKGDEGSEIQSQNNKKGKKTKLSQKISEYEQSISQQMQKQRMYFEDNINKEVKKRKDLIKEKKKLIAQAQTQISELDKQLQQAEQKREEYETGSAKYEKQLKAISQVQKYWKSLSDKIKQENNEKAEYEKKQIRELDEMIASKKQELKDFQRNKELSVKIKSNVGKDQVEKTVILGTYGGGSKDPKKKKK